MIWRLLSTQHKRGLIAVSRVIRRVSFCLTYSFHVSRWLNPLSKDANAWRVLSCNLATNSMASGQREGGEKRKGIKVNISTQLFIASSTPTLCGYTASLDYCGDSNRTYQQAGQRQPVLEGVLNPKACWLCGTETVWKRVWDSTAVLIPTILHLELSHEAPVAETDTDGYIIHTYTQYTFSLYVRVRWDRWMKDPRHGGVLFGEVSHFFKWIRWGCASPWTHSSIR